jgi:hypothetical protein
MSLSGIFARIVALIGAAAILWRRLQDGAHKPAVGSAPAIPAAKPQGSIPTLKMPPANGWTPGQMPVAAPGLRDNAFATGLKHPRWIHVLPNGDVTVAEALFLPGPITSIFDYAMVSTMKRAAWGSQTASALRSDGDSVESRDVFLDRLNQPSAWPPGLTFYIGNTDGMVAFPTSGAARARRKQLEFKPGGLDAQPAAELMARGSCRGRLAEQYRRPAFGRGGPGGDLELELKPVGRTSPRACATRARLEPRTACSGRWSTSATGSATRRRPTT